MKSEMTSSCGARLILVAPGSFIMGSPANEVGRAHWERECEVTLPYEFYLGATPLTQRQFELIIPSPAYATCSWAEGRAADERGTSWNRSLGRPHSMSRRPIAKEPLDETYAAPGSLVSGRYGPAGPEIRTPSVTAREVRRLSRSRASAFRPQTHGTTRATRVKVLVPAKSNSQYEYCTLYLQQLVSVLERV